MNSKHSRKMHFKKRILERYSLKINSKDIARITTKCHCDFLLCWKQSQKKRLLVIEYMGQIIFLAFQIKLNVPITALPIENLSKYLEDFKIIAKK